MNASITFKPNPFVIGITQTASELIGFHSFIYFSNSNWHFVPIICCVGFGCYHFALNNNVFECIKFAGTNRNHLQRRIKSAENYSI